MPGFAEPVQRLVLPVQRHVGGGVRSPQLRRGLGIMGPHRHGAIEQCGIARGDQYPEGLGPHIGRARCQRQRQAHVGTRALEIALQLLDRGVIYIYAIYCQQ